MGNIELKDHLSVREFAKRLGISKQAVSKQIKKGSIQHVRLGIIWIHKNQIKKYKEIQKSG